MKLKDAKKLKIGDWVTERAAPHRSGTIIAITFADIGDPTPVLIRFNHKVKTHGREVTEPVIIRPRQLSDIPF